MKVMIGAGGTGGHINPALAIAKHIRKKRPGSDILFCGGRTGLEQKLVTREGFRLETFDVSGFRRSMSVSGIAYNLGVGRKALAALAGAKKLIRDFKPDVVIGCGGYASFPLVYQAQRMKIPTAVLEINALPGVTTKVLARRADAVMICFEQTRSLIKSDKVVMTGSPVREDILFARRENARRKPDHADKPLIVSVWGSLGASAMNRMMVDFIALEASEGRHRLVHAIGGHGYDRFPGLLAERGIDLERYANIDVREYIYDMAEVLSEADLVMCRAGAATLAELAILAKPAILIPSPNVAENHQEKNARALESEGAAIVFMENEIDGKRLYEEASKLLNDREKMRRMSRNIQKFATYDAIEKICDCIRSLVEKK